LKRRKARIYDELLKKNGNNERIIRRFSRKVTLQRNRDKIARLGSLDLANSAPLPTSRPKDSPPLASSRLLQRSSRLSRREGLEPIENIQDCISHYTRLQERVDRALKHYEPR
jgi:hypothetical protein